MFRAARAYLGLSITSLIWAGAFIAGKLVTAELTPLAASGLRHLAAALVLLPFAWRMRRAGNLRAALPSLAVMALVIECGMWATAPFTQLAGASAAAVAALAFLVLFASVLAGQLFLFGVHSVGVGRTVVFVYLVPVLTALLSAAFLGEPLLPSQVLGGALVLMGVAVTTRSPAPAPEAEPVAA